MAQFIRSTRSCIPVEAERLFCRVLACLRVCGVDLARWCSGLGAFDVHSLAKSRELKLTMMFVQGRLVRPSHRFGQIRIFASALRAPSAKIRPFRGQSVIASRGSRGGRNIDWFRIKRNWISASQTVHNPVPERVFFVAHKQCSKGKSWSVRVPHHRQGGTEKYTSAVILASGSRAVEEPTHIVSP